MASLSEGFERLTIKFNSMLPHANAPSVHLTLPPLSLLKVFPLSFLESDPQALPPPVSDATFARPFNISEETYNNALNASIPITIALIYAAIARYLNRVNRQRDNKPWGFSNTSVFYLFVLLHNLFLAAYSAWTFLGMANAIRHTWPTGEGEYKLPRAADALCKLHGPRGYGSAATFSPANHAWSFTDRTMKLDSGLPDTTDVGRLWNEGLAFYGWLFYLSKFYEVVDTLIILAKGKNTAFFQTYHHAGAMFCTWAGIRYMSPPIWMFVIVNSGIHTLMYTYYALNHLGIRVSQRLKSTLTRLQIIQFVFGATYAMAHLFIAYDIPVETPYLFVHNLSSALPTAASSISSAIASATASADIGSWIKKAALRAAGEEGLAENVRNTQGQPFGIDAIHAAEVEKAQEEIRYKTQYQTVNCLDTPGEAFAILLNFAYLAPLTIMFANFFVDKYVKNSRSSSPPSKTENVQQSGKAAAKDIKKELEEAMSTEQNDLEAPLPDLPPQVASRAEKLNKSTKDFSNKAKNVAQETADRVIDGAHQANNIFQDKLQAATDTASEKVNETNKKMKGPKDKPSESKDANDEPSKSKGTKDEPAKQSDSSSAESSKEYDAAPKPEPPSLSTDGRKQSKSRSQSPQKKTQLPRPQSKNRQHSPEKKDAPLKEEEKPQTNGELGEKGESKEEHEKEAKDKSKGEKNGDEEKPSSLDESAYEVNPDELKNEEEKKAEAEMQPNLG
ncbi:MAG: hypothetical protein Q9201_007412 [Fulgogasparrea decipioides]